jgi:hypothetical protein
MWDDEIDKNIIDAANQYHPAYDENAWDKMKLMLDEHLPVEKKKRRFLIIPIIALLVAGSFFIYHYNKNNNIEKNAKINTANKNAGTIDNAPEKSEVLSKDNITVTQQQQRKSSSIADVSSITNSLPLLVSVVPSTATGKGSIRHQQYSIYNSVDKNNNKKIAITESKIKKYKTSGTIVSITSGAANDGKLVMPTKDHKVDNSSNKDEQQNKAKKDIPSETSPNTEATPEVKKEITPAKKDTVAKTDKVMKAPGKKKLPTRKGFSNNFGITFSAGPDVSGINFNHSGKVAINYGAGVSYAISARFALRTGFHVSDKIYSADKYQYHSPQGMATNNYLYNIAANCKVYEIPVTVSYNFRKAKNHQWFASAGLSSYLMKMESYDYYYKYPNGSLVTKSWSISNQNQNYFSVVDLSAGYEYSFSKRASLLAEPYLKMPLSGVGAGKVKLNSGGLLFTFVLKPFYKK